MKKIFAMLTAVTILAFSAQADLFWYNSAAILDENGDPVVASDSDSTVGYFAQLIFAGVNGPDLFVASGSGVSGDDAVVDTMFAGQNDFLFVDGFFPLQVSPALSGPSGNGDYFVRVFNAPNLNFNDGNAADIPGSATFYFQSDVLSYTHNDTQPELFDFAPMGGQTLNVVPEPSTLAMLGISLAALARMRRRFVA